MVGVNTEVKGRCEWIWVIAELWVLNLIWGSGD